MMVATTKVSALTLEEHFQKNETYTNNNNVTITKENYNKIKEYMTEEQINQMTDNHYSFITQSNEIQAYKSVIIETTTYTNNLKEKTVNEKIITEEEFLEILSKPTLVSDCGAGCWETNYKQVQLTVSKVHNGLVNVYIENDWKKIPQHQSYDILGLRWSKSSTINSYSGTQENGSSGYVNYPMTSSNFNVDTFGIGLSQNLVNNAARYNNSMMVTLACSNRMVIYGTYQHAQGTLTLAQSKSYSISTGGLGDVLYFSNSTIRNTYDGMQGVSLSVKCT